MGIISFREYKNPDCYRQEFRSENADKRGFNGLNPVSRTIYIAIVYTLERILQSLSESSYFHGE